MDRRRVLGLGAAMLAMIGEAASAAIKTITIPAEKLFPYLKDYYTMPAAERSAFRMAYFAQAPKAGPEGIQIKLLYKGQSLPLVPGKGGLIAPLPAYEALRDKADLTLSAAEGVNFSIRLELMPAFAPEARMEAVPLKIALAQATKSVKKAAGLMAVAVPEYDTVLITGVNSGEVVLKDGSHKALPLKPAFTSKSGVAFPAVPYFTPAKWPEAAFIQFPASPEYLLLNPAPKAA